MPILRFIRSLFSRSQPSVPLEQTSYDIAYFVLPPTVHENLGIMQSVFDKGDKVTRAFYYLMACQARGISPDPEAAMLYSWHHGAIDNTWSYHILQYPEPPAVNIGPADMSAMFDAAKKITLAPYFSAILYAYGQGPQYYVLGQTSMGGGTTLRSVTAEGANCNLGPGPSPSLDSFLGVLRERMAAEQCREPERR